MREQGQGAEGRGEKVGWPTRVWPICTLQSRPSSRWGGPGGRRRLRGGWGSEKGRAPGGGRGPEGGGALKCWDLRGGGGLGRGGGKSGPSRSRPRLWRGWACLGVAQQGGREEVGVSGRGLVHWAWPGRAAPPTLPHSPSSSSVTSRRSWTSASSRPRARARPGSNAWSQSRALTTRSWWVRDPCRAGRAGRACAERVPTGGRVPGAACCSVLRGARGRLLPPDL